MIKTGDHITIECEGRSVDGEVMMASPNGASLFLRFDAILSNHVGMMPVLLDEKTGDYRSLVGNVVVKVVKK